MSDNDPLSSVKKKISQYSNKRVHVRYDFEKEIKYSMQFGNSDETFSGIIRNISDKGMSLFVFNPLQAGQTITLKSDVSNLNKSGVVQWCRELGENVYKVGLMFLREHKIRSGQNY